jgi:threonine dehydrogenase-like Zn-dependent dehydrogenase
MITSAVAPRFIGNGQIEFAERSVPSPGPGELLLRVRANAICGSDRAQYFDGSEVTPGHETVGTVEVVGPDTDTPIGATGAVYLMDYCGRCGNCLQGFTNQCSAKRADMGFNRDGGFGPFEVVHESNFFPVPEVVSPIQATLLLDVMGTSSHAIRRAQLVRPDINSIFIAGAGPIGLGLLVMSQLMFGDEVTIHISDISDWRRTYASQLGGIAVDPSDASAMDVLPPKDVAFDSTGKATARRDAFGVLAKRGVLVCVGHGESLVLDVSEDLISPERAVLGSEYFPFSELPTNLELLLANRDRLSAVVTHTFPIRRLKDAFEAFLGGKTGKVVVTQDPS